MKNNKAQPKKKREAPLRHPMLKLFLGDGAEMAAERARQYKMMDRFFELYEIEGPRNRRAWEELAFMLAGDYVPGFSSTRKQGRRAGQPDDLDLMTMIELLRRRHRWSVPKACAVIAEVRAIDKPAKTLRERYKVLMNRDPHWKTLLDSWSIEDLEGDYEKLLDARARVIAPNYIELAEKELEREGAAPRIKPMTGVEKN